MAIHTSLVRILCITKMKKARRFHHEATHVRYVLIMPLDHRGCCCNISYQWGHLMKLNLISNGRSNPKTNKSNKQSDKYLTFILHLRPVNTKICPFQNVAKCKSACLNTAGLGGVYPSIQKARQRKTDLFLNDRNEFMRQLFEDLTKIDKYCTNKGKVAAVRLNGTSDIQYELIKVNGSNVFDTFPNITFYDYTKIPNRKISNIKNYSLTWSYSEANKKYSDYFNTVPNNIAVVFRDKLPKTFNTKEVINGDLTDLRFLDPVNVIVGLKAKGKAKKDYSGFVVNN